MAGVEGSARVIEGSTRVLIAFAGLALTLTVVIVGASWNLSGKLSGIRDEVYGLRLELAKDYATKKDVVKLRDALADHKTEAGHRVILDRVKRLEKAHDAK